VFSSLLRRKWFSDNDVVRLICEYVFCRMSFRCGHHACGRVAVFSNTGRHNRTPGRPRPGNPQHASGGNYGVLSGTSMATPHLTGAVALLAARIQASIGARSRT